LLAEFFYLPRNRAAFADNSRGEYYQNSPEFAKISENPSFLTQP